MNAAYFSVFNSTDKQFFVFSRFKRGWFLLSNSVWTRYFCNKCIFLINNLTSFPLNWKCSNTTINLMAFKRIKQINLHRANRICALLKCRAYNRTIYIYFIHIHLYTCSKTTLHIHTNKRDDRIDWKKYGYVNFGVVFYVDGAKCL